VPPTKPPSMITSAANVLITSAAEAPNNMTVLIWGRSGVGKTTLACTAPGRKLIVNFDPNGPASVASRSDVSVLDLSTADAGLAAKFKDTDPFGLSKHLAGFDTVVLDSLSSVQELALRQGIAMYAASNATIENPTRAGYGARGALVLELVRNLLLLCARMSKHLILIGHAGAPKTNEEGATTSIPIMLGGQLPTNISVKLSEIWIMHDMDKGAQKNIAIRPTRQYEIAKTRMFITTGTPEFVWTFDPERGDEEQTSMTIADWYRRWLDNGKRKIPLPKK
jgi:hypothetical protein